MKQGDPEATEGLERAKSGMLKRPKQDPPSVVENPAPAAPLNGEAEAKAAPEPAKEP